MKRLRRFARRRPGKARLVVTQFGLALLLVVLAVLAVVVLPGAGLIVGVILVVVAIVLLAQAFRRGRAA